MASNGVPRFLKYVFPASVNTEIALPQLLTGPGSLLLNGLYADPTGVNPNVSILNQGFSSTVSLASLNDNSAVEFTINGYQNGVFITETIAGPNDDSVQTVGVYDVVTSITTNGAIDGTLSSGIGTQAYFRLIAVDPNAIFIFYGLQVYWPGSTNALNGFIYGTLDNIINNGLTYQDMINVQPYGALYENNNFNSPISFSNLDPGATYIVSINPQNNQPVTLVFKQGA